MTRKEKIGIALGGLQGSLVCGVTTTILMSLGCDYNWALVLGLVVVPIIGILTINIHDRLAEKLS